MGEKRDPPHWAPPLLSSRPLEWVRAGSRLHRMLLLVQPDALLTQGVGLAARQVLAAPSGRACSDNLVSLPTHHPPSLTRCRVEPQVYPVDGGIRQPPRPVNVALRSCYLRMPHRRLYLEYIRAAQSGQGAKRVAEPVGCVLLYPRRSSGLLDHRPQPNRAIGGAQAVGHQGRAVAGIKFDGQVLHSLRYRVTCYV